MLLHTYLAQTSKIFWGRYSQFSINKHIYIHIHIFWPAHLNLTLLLYLLKGSLWLHPSANLHKCLHLNACQHFEVGEITTFLKQKAQIQVHLFSFCILGSCDKALLQTNFPSSSYYRASAISFGLFVGLTWELSLFCFSVFTSPTMYTPKLFKV